MRTAARRQPRLLHLQRLPPAGRGQRRGADRRRQRHGLLAGAVALGLRRDRPLPRPRQPAALARLRRLRRHPALQRDSGARHLPRPPGPRPDARPARSRARRWRCTGGSAASTIRGAGCSRASRRTSRSCATTRSPSPTWGPTARVTAWTDDGVVMGIEHRRRPLWGVQFHPESIATEHGARLVENFYELARRAALAALATARKRPLRARARAASRRTPSRSARRQRAAACADPRRTVDRAALRTPVRRRRARLLARQRRRADAARAALLPRHQRRPRPLRARVRRRVRNRRSAHARRRHDDASAARSSTCSTASSRAHAIEPPRADLPPGLLGGFVGYLGYECKADCGSPNVHRSDVPDAVMMLANRVVAVDHVRRRTHLVALCRGDEAEAERWLDEAEQVVREIARRPARAGGPLAIAEGAGAAASVSFRCGRGREQYLADIARCQAELAAGESYEVCLTDQISTDASPDPFDLYRLLRRRNPAPFAAYLKLGELAVRQLLARALPLGRPRPPRRRRARSRARRSRSADPAARRGAARRADRTTRRPTPST